MRQSRDLPQKYTTKILTVLTRTRPVGRVRAAALLCFLSKYNTMFCKCQVFFEKNFKKY